jgi:8-hydroxy-5-deazaflavin:NADPH oxidoreductase
VIDSTNPGAKEPSNPLAAYGIKAIGLGGKHSSEAFREFLPGGRLIKAFNHLDANVPSQPGGIGRSTRPVIFRRRCQRESPGSRDHERTGYFPVDLGVLDVGAPLASLPFSSLAAISFLQPEIRAHPRRARSGRSVSKQSRSTSPQRGGRSLGAAVD